MGPQCTVLTFSALRSMSSSEQLTLGAKLCAMAGDSLGASRTTGGGRRGRPGTRPVNYTSCPGRVVTRCCCRDDVRRCALPSRRRLCGVRTVGTRTMTHNRLQRPHAVKMRFDRTVDGHGQRLRAKRRTDGSVTEENKNSARANENNNNRGKSTPYPGITNAAAAVVTSSGRRQSVRHTVPPLSERISIVDFGQIDGISIVRRDSG